jgi:hypothetical protein
VKARDGKADGAAGYSSQSSPHSLPTTSAGQSLLLFAKPRKQTAEEHGVPVALRGRMFSTLSKGYGGRDGLEFLAIFAFLMRCCGGAGRACVVVLNLACSFWCGCRQGSNRPSGTCFGGWPRSRSSIDAVISSTVHVLYSVAVVLTPWSQRQEGFFILTHSADYLAS